MGVNKQSNKPYFKLKALLIFVIVALFVVGNSTHAYFKDLGIGARPLGMGGAYTAVSDDGNAALWNAAGLAQIDTHEVTAMFAALYVGLGAKLYNEKTDRLGYHSICYVHPSGLGSFALSWSTFQSQLYDENTFCLSYSRELSLIPYMKEYKAHLYFGLNLKEMGWSIGGNEYTVLDSDIPDRGTSKNGFTIDLSTLYKASDRLSFGFSAENLLPADVGLNTEEGIPINVRGGIAYRIHNLGRWVTNLLIAMDITYRAGDGANIRMGAENWFLDGSLGARAGWNPESATSGLSYRIIRERWHFQIDYAFVYPLTIQDTFGSHRMSISVRF